MRSPQPGMQPGRCPVRGTLIYPWDSIPLLSDPKQSEETSLTVISGVINMYSVTGPETPLPKEKGSNSLVDLLLVSLLLEVKVRVDRKSEGRQISGSDHHFHLQPHQLLILMQGDDIQNNILHHSPAQDVLASLLSSLLTDGTGEYYPQRALTTCPTSSLPSNIKSGEVSWTSSVKWVSRESDP